MRTMLAILAFVLLSLALRVCPHLPEHLPGQVPLEGWLGLVLVLAALALALTAACLGGPDADGPTSTLLVGATLGSLLACELLWILTTPAIFSDLRPDASPL